MNELAIRQSIIDHCKAMNASGLNQGTSGNISVRFGERMLITPSGIPYDTMTPDMIASLPLSGDGAWRAPMGTVVIGGLLLSTLLTLLIVPAGFSLADGLEKRLGPWLRKRVLTYEPEHALPGPMEPQPAE